MALEIDKIFDIAEVTVNGDDPSKNNLPLLALTTPEERGAFLRFKHRADVWIRHLGQDQSGAAANHTVYLINEGENPDKSFWFFNNTATLTNPFLLEDLPNANKLLLHCKTGTSAKIEIKLVVRSEGRRDSA